MNYGGIFDLTQIKNRIIEIEKMATEQDFWKDSSLARKMNQEKVKLEKELKKWVKIEDGCEEISVLFELSAESDGSDLLPEIEGKIKVFNDDISHMEVERLFSGDKDINNAIVTIHPGAGGTESQDWAQMLMRMYMRWAEKRGFAIEIMDLQSGDEAGIKSVTFLVTGEFAYGYLRAEAGVHRLVRISPFDANKRRHTSFASIFVYPEIDDDIDLVIDEKDLKIDTYRASSAGGQHVNKTSSAVRITHLPTNIVVQCQNERSQHKNKSFAMKVLRARLFELEKEKKEKELSETLSEKKEIGWGSQIRSYVFQPYQMVKDHRTNVEMGNVSAVMDGDLDKFMEAYLLQTAKALA